MESHGLSQQNVVTEKAEESPNVLNLFMLGTNEHSESSLTLLTSLYDALEVDQTHAKYLINGPGGVSRHSDTKNPLLGRYTAEVSYDSETGELRAKKEALKSWLDPLHQARGLAWGEGRKAAYDEALAAVEAMIRAGKKPLRINMVGFSRGADILLRICNRLNDLYPNGEVEINFLAIDPVPGPFNQHHKSARTLPPIVKRYEGVYMLHESRSEFALKDKNTLIIPHPEKTKVIEHIISGTHSHPERFIEDPYSNESKGTDAGKILWEIAHRFAEETGAGSFSHIPYVKKLGSGKYHIYPEVTPRLTDEEYLNCYTRMIEDEVYYQNLGRKVGVTPRRIVTRKRDYFLHGHAVFQDLKHLKLFKQLYPNFFDFYFQMNKGGVTKEAVEADIARLQQNELLANYISKCMLFDLNNPPTEPQGIPITVEDLYRKNNPVTHLWENIQASLFGIIAGFDVNDISILQAEEILAELHHVVIADLKEDEKLKRMQELIADKIVTYSDKPVAKKLTVFVPNKRPIDILINYLERQAQELGQEDFYKELIKYLEYRVIAIEKIKAQEGSDLTKKAYEIDEMLKALVAELSSINTPSVNPSEFHQVDPVTEENNPFASLMFASEVHKDKVIRFVNNAFHHPHQYAEECKEIFRAFLKEELLKERSAQHEKLILLAEMTKSYLEIISNLGGGNDTKAVHEILATALEQIHLISPDHPLSKKLKAYKFTMVTSVSHVHENSELLGEQIHRYKTNLPRLMNPEKVFAQLAFDKVLNYLRLCKEKNEDEVSTYIIDQTIALLNKLSYLTDGLETQTVKEILEMGKAAATRLGDQALVEAFEAALKENGIGPEIKKTTNLKMLQDKINEYAYELKIIAPYSLLERAIMDLERYIEKAKDENQRIATECLKALHKYRAYVQDYGQNEPLLKSILQLTYQKVAHDKEDELPLLLDELLDQVIVDEENPQNETQEVGAAARANIIFSELEEALYHTLTVKFTLPFGLRIEREIEIKTLDGNVSLRQLKDVLRAKIKANYCNNDTIVEFYLDRLRLRVDNTDLNPNVDQSIPLKNDQSLELTYHCEEQAQHSEKFLSTLVKFEEALRTNKQSEIAKRFLNLARLLRKLQPSNDSLEMQAVHHFPKSHGLAPHVIHFDLATRLTDLNSNPHKPRLYRKLYQFAQAIELLSKAHVEPALICKYQNLYHELLQQIATSKTKSDLNTLNIVMDHFINLAVPISSRTKARDKLLHGAEPESSIMSLEQMAYAIHRLRKKLPNKSLKPFISAAICDSELTEQLNLLDTPYKEKLYPYLHQLKLLIARMRTLNVDANTINKYQDLYNELKNQISTSTHTTNVYDPVPIVMNHFTRLGEEICKRKAAWNNSAEENRKNPGISVEEMTRSMQKLDKKLAMKKPMDPRLKALLCGVIGAIVGFSLGLVVGGAITFWAGGFGALPLAIAAGIKGFTLGTAIGLGTAGAVGVTAGACGFFHNAKKHKEYVEMQDLTANKDLKTFYKSKFSGE